jgi:hypothetical protein
VADAADRSIRSTFSEAVSAIRSQSGEPDWADFRSDLEERLRARFDRIARDIGKASKMPGARLDVMEDETARMLDRKARDAAKQLASESRDAYRAGVSRLSRAGLSEAQVREWMRPLRGLNDAQTQSAVNRMLAMREAGASATTIRNDAAKMGRKKASARGRAIARTSSLDVATASQEEAVRQGLDSGDLARATKQWVAALDVTHAECKRLDGQRRKVGESFVDPMTRRKVNNPPLHPNCRCGVQYDAVRSSAAA